MFFELFSDVRLERGFLLEIPVRLKSDTNGAKLSTFPMLKNERMEYLTADYADVYGWETLYKRFYVEFYGDRNRTGKFLDGISLRIKLRRTS